MLQNVKHRDDPEAAVRPYLISNPTLAYGISILLLHNLDGL
jgi:hypothetical protein